MEKFKYKSQTQKLKSKIKYNTFYKCILLKHVVKVPKLTPLSVFSPLLETLASHFTLISSCSSITQVKIFLLCFIWCITMMISSFGGIIWFLQVCHAFIPMICCYTLLLSSFTTWNSNLLCFLLHRLNIFLSCSSIVHPHCFHYYYYSE